MVKQSMIHTGIYLLCGLLAFAVAAPAFGQDRSAVTFLTSEPSTDPPLEIALSYLQSDKRNLTAGDLAALEVRQQTVSKHTGTTHIYLVQKLDGIEVVNSITNVNISRDGRVINVGDHLVADLAAAINVREPRLSPEKAILGAAGSTDPRLSATLPPVVIEKATGPDRRALFSGAGISLDPIPVRLVYYAINDGSVRLGWDVTIRSLNQPDWWSVVIDAVDGEVLFKNNWTQWDSYRVYANPLESPKDGDRTLEVDPADADASPFGWHDTDGSAGAEFTDTRGNNVQAQTDLDADNSFTAGVDVRPSGGGSLDFDFPIDLALGPETYRDAAVTNLFYHNNVIHDILVQYGFDEASGNFQSTNYGGAPGGLDPVLADAQDGSGTNNANFSTPPDGFAPRMQMFVWLPTADHEVVVDSGTAAGTYDAASAAFGPPLDTTGVSGGLVVADDGTGVTSDACEALINGAQVSGNIAIMDRGTCSFVTKVRNAQNAGATAAIVVNNAGDDPIVMGDDGTGGDITISSVMVGQSDGDAIANDPTTGTVRKKLDPPPNRDSDLDAGVVYHEYCHGLSIRLTGGRNSVNCLTGDQQAGEGWSDLCALFFTPDPADVDTTARGVGSYLLFEDTGPMNGIRPFPYTTDLAVNPLTYGDLTTAGQPGGLSIPHGVGTVWASIVWEAYWALTNEYGFDADLYGGSGGNNLAIQLVVDGLKLQPCNPTFVDARDAILLADQNLTCPDASGTTGIGDCPNQCLLWEAFAKRGLGVDADDGGSAGSLAVTEDFTVPAECQDVCGNGICQPEFLEDCNSCPSDCPSGTAGATCGNDVCEAGNGEDCVSCPQDCNGQQSGKPSSRFCCGPVPNSGTNPVPCTDPRCSGGGITCTDEPVGGSFCCGDGIVDGGESCSNCVADVASEESAAAMTCDDGSDNDCNTVVDCGEFLCRSDPACDVVCADVGESCAVDADCCSGDCSSGKPSSRVCLAP